MINITEGRFNKMLDNNEVSTSRDVLNALKKRKIAINKIIKALEIKLDSAPKGGLRVLKRKNYFQYYWRQNSQEVNGVYIPKSDIGSARRLAQRDYEQKVLDIAKEEFNILSSYECLLNNTSIETALELFNEGRKKLIDPISISDEKYIELWKNEEYAIFEFNDDTSEIYSASGIRVRSKSEVIIANLLEQYGIPYKYEYPLSLGKMSVRPDFLCLNARTRNEYVWEHFGMMDDPEYANKNIKKISRYEQNGYLAGKNMILTFETSLTPINSNIIKAMIENYLI